MTVDGKRKHKDWQYKNDSSLVVIKSTIIMCNIFYLKVIIFENTILVKDKIFNFDQV